MIQMNQKWDKLLKLFFENPNEKFSVREIAAKTGIPSASVQRYLKKLKEKKLILSENKANVTPRFRFLRTSYIIDKMYETGLIEYLEVKLVPETIVLFGSVRKGEYDKESDIDIFAASTKKAKLDLRKFEKALGHEIQVFVEKDINDLQVHLKNNVINGIKLSGYFKIGDGRRN